MKQRKQEIGKDYLNYRTITRMTVKECRLASDEMAVNSSRNLWIEWTASVADEIEKLDIETASKILAKVKTEFETAMKRAQRMRDKDSILQSFPIGPEASSGSCAESMIEDWLYFEAASRAEEWNREGNLCYFAVNRARDYSQAVSYYYNAARAKNKDAMVNLGNCYYYGKGMTADKSLAMKWYEKAAEDGHKYGQFNLAHCYQHVGPMTRADGLKAAYWYEKAAEQDVVEAMSRLGDYYMENNNYAKAIEWYKKAAPRGDCNAQKSLGYCYRFGKGTKIDLAEALKWYGEAAKQGDSAALAIVEDLLGQRI